MGLVKGRDGYELPSDVRPLDESSPTALVQAVRQWLSRTTIAQNLLVLHTPPSGASPLALALDRAQMRGVAGTIAGDDTVLVVCLAATDARRVRRDLERLSGAAS